MRSLTPELVREMARLCGVTLDLERAKALIPALEDGLEGDEAITNLGLGTLSAVGNPWPQERDV